MRLCLSLQVEIRMSNAPGQGLRRCTLNLRFTKTVVTLAEDIRHDCLFTFFLVMLNSCSLPQRSASVGSIGEVFLEEGLDDHLTTQLVLRS